MKKILLFLITAFSLNIFSQGCSNPLQFCSGTNYNMPLTTGSTVAPAGPNYGCLGSQPNPTFFYFQISDSGNLVLNVAGSAGGDVDAICWGPFTTPTVTCDSGATFGGCGGLPSSLTNHTSCSGNIVDCSYSADATETITVPNALVGQYYVFMVTNYSNVLQNLVLDQTNGTGSTSCDSINTTSINYLSNPTDFNIYPNPAKTNVTVYQSEIAKSIEIIDVLGNTVLTLIPQSNTETINVQNLNKGIYFVKSSTAKGIFCKKLLIE